MMKFKNQNVLSEEVRQLSTNTPSAELRDVVAMIKCENVEMYSQRKKMIANNEHLQE